MVVFLIIELTISKAVMLIFVKSILLKLVYVNFEGELHGYEQGK